MAETQANSDQGQGVAATAQAQDTVAAGAGGDPVTMAGAADAAEETKRGPGRPPKENPEIAALKARLAALESAQQSNYEQGLAQIQAQKEERKTVAPIGDIKDDKQPGIWAQFVGNPRAGFEGPDFVTMYGYRFQRGGQMVLVKGDELARNKFRGNGEFVTEEVEDASDLEDGDIKDAPTRGYAASDMRVGKIAA